MPSSDHPSDHQDSSAHKFVVFLIGPLFVVVIGSFLYMAFRGSTPFFASFNVAANQASSNAPMPQIAVPYGDLTTNTQLPGESGLDQARRAARARIEASGGTTANTAQTSLGTGTLDLGASGERGGAGLTRRQVIDEMQKRYSLLNARYGLLEAQISRPTSAALQNLIKDTEDARQYATWQLEWLYTTNASNWPTVVPALDTSLDELSYRLDRLQAALAGNLPKAAEASPGLTPQAAPGDGGGGQETGQGTQGTQGADQGRFQ